MVTNTILVVEDEPVIRENIVEILEKKGFTVFSAINGSVGFKLAGEQHPDMIISDITIPVMTGTQLLKNICLQKSLKLHNHIYQVVNYKSAF